MKNIKLRRIFALLTLLLLFISSFTFVAADDNASINNEKLVAEDIISIKDAILIFRYLAGKAVEVHGSISPKKTFNTYDYNNDGVVNIDDAIIVFKYLAGKIDEEDLKNFQDSKDDDTIINKPENFDVLVPELGQRIIESFRLQYKNDDAYISDYYGCFNGCEIIYMAGIVISEVETYVEIEGYIFTLPGTPPRLYVHRNSEFLPLKEAYESGWISKENVKDIWDVFTYINNSSLSDRFRLQYENDDAYVSQYMGHYGWCSIVNIGGIAQDTVMIDVEIAGYVFTFPGRPPTLYVCNYLKFLPLKEAYEAGWINDNDIKRLWNKYHENEFELGVILIGLNEKYTGSSPEKLLPELKIKTMVDINEQMYNSMKDLSHINKEALEHIREQIGTVYMVYLIPQTREAVLEAIELLAHNSYIRYAEPNYIGYPA